MVGVRFLPSCMMTSPSSFTFVFRTFWMEIWKSSPNFLVSASWISCFIASLFICFSPFKVVLLDKKADTLYLMSASPMSFRRIRACADIRSAVTVCVSLKTCYRQNSYGLYIVERVREKIRKGKDRMMICRILSGYKVIYWNSFFIMVVYREKGSFVIV